MHSILEFKKILEKNATITDRYCIEVIYRSKIITLKESQMCVFRETFYVECVNIKIFTTYARYKSLICL